MTTSGQNAGNINAASWRYLAAAALSFTLALAGLNLFAAWPGNPIFQATDILFRASCAIYSIASLMVHFRITKSDKFPNGHHQNSVRPLKRHHAEALQVSAAESRMISPKQAGIFVTALLKPRIFRQRVVESYELGSRTLHQRVSIEGQIPRNFLEKNQDGDRVFPEEIYFPVLVPDKGKFQDAFSLYDAEANSIIALSYREYLQITAISLRLILSSAFKKPFLTLPRRVKIAELRALGLIQARRDIDGTFPVPPAAYRWHDLLRPNSADPTAIDAKKSAMSLVAMLTGNYVIVAVVRPDKNGRFLIKFEQTLIPDLRLTRRLRRGVTLGTRPIDLTFSIKAASTCQSYHLRVNAPEGIYVGDQQLGKARDTLEKVAEEHNIPPHYRFRKRLGQPHAHFYCRFFPEAATGESPQVRTSYFEIPPGSLMRAAVSAAACLLLVWLVAVVSSRVPDPGTDAPAILLAFPAVVAAWLGFDTPSRRLLEGTFAARASLLVTVLTSILASGLFMGHKALAEEYEWWHFPNKISFLWISDISWAALTTLAFLNAAVVNYTYFSRVARFIYLSARPQGGDVVQHS